MGWTLRAIVGCVAAAAACAAWGQASGADADALRGPKVAERAQTKATLIERDADGRIKRLELDPALAALSMLDLDDPTRERVDKVVAARLSALDRVVRDNLFTIAELAQANQAGDRRSAQKLLADLYVKARPYIDRGPWVEELRPALGADQHARLKALVEEYTKACISERMAGVDENGNRPNRLGAAFAENLHALGQEVRRSYERTIQQDGDEFEKLLAELGLSPEQEAKIRQRVTDAFLNAKGKPTRAQTTRVFLQSYQELDAKQRERLIEIINRNRAEERAAKKASARTDSEPPGR